jgi:hypothetical protein
MGISTTQDVMSDFDAVLLQATDIFSEFSVPDFSQRLRQQA